jgi:2-polyprenyl-3-methyl-5-hydroxy-6-metoxy-1,4-benzoquinol methylase
MITIDKCLVCGSNQFEPFLVCKDYTVSQEQFNIVSCKSCGFKFTSPRPDNSVLGNYYKAESYVSHTDSKKGFVNKLYHMVRSYTLKQKMKLVSSYVSRGTILDYGCGTGMFLSACKSAGWEAYGMEPDADARRIAYEKNLSLFCDKNTMQLHLAEREFDAITLWHVLEHVTDMHDTLAFFKHKLKSDGVLVIAVPNYESFDANYYKECWAAYDVPRHLYHFDLKSLNSLLDHSGFQLVETKPMKFDSVYVSMLSEKYKTGKVNLAQAFRIGMQSNMKAKDSSSYSSTIYIFQHK